MISVHLKSALAIVFRTEAGIEIAAGTRFADIPADWRCPLCDVGKEDFALVEF